MTSPDAQPDDRPMRVLLVEDHRLFRQGLRDLLEAHGHEVVGESATARDGVRLAAEKRPDVVLLDVNLPGGSGLDVIADVLERAPGSAILMLTASARESDLLDAIAAGASGYLLKDAPIEEMLAGIQAAAAGDSAISPLVAGKLVRHVRDRFGVQAADEQAADAEKPELSDRERKVLRLLVAGRDNAEIASELFLSVGTVKAHVTGILRTLGVDNRVQAAVEAVRRGLV